MSAPVSGSIAIGALDLAALLCSRVCHDLISPVGAIVNGIEVMEEDKDEETKTFALDLIKKSAYQASAKLQFCRLAFGAAGSAGAQIDLGDAEKAARGLIEDGKITLAWNLPRQLLAKNRVKLLLNMLLIGAGSISRGGTLTVDPGFTEAMHGLARALQDLQRYDEAIVVAQQITELDPDDVLAHTSLSVLYQKKGMVPEAEAEGAKARVLGWKQQLKKGSS